jgi:hypothetical protein
MSNLTEEEQQEILRDQIKRWKNEMAVIADKIAFASGQGCAAVFITATDETYSDVHPQLVLEDAMRINPHGWPNGFTFDLLHKDKS